MFALVAFSSMSYCERFDIGSEDTMVFTNPKMDKSKKSKVYISCVEDDKSGSYHRFISFQGKHFHYNMLVSEQMVKGLKKFLKWGRIADKNKIYKARTVTTTRTLTWARSLENNKVILIALEIVMTFIPSKEKKVLHMQMYLVTDKNGREEMTVVPYSLGFLSKQVKEITRLVSEDTVKKKVKKIKKENSLFE